MKTLRSIGLAKAFRYSLTPVVDLAFSLACYSPLRVLLLKALGAHVGGGTVLFSLRFVNFYRGSFSNLRIGDDCFVGDEVMFDLTSPITIGNQVSIGSRTIFSTHLNVGYSDHPLQSSFPTSSQGITIGSGTFIGVGAIVTDGCRVGEKVFAAAGSVIVKDIADGEVVGGVPAKPLKVAAKAPSHA